MCASHGTNPHVSPGADVEGASPVPVQMWAGASPVPVQMWAGVSPASVRCATRLELDDGLLCPSKVRVEQVALAHQVVDVLVLELRLLRQRDDVAFDLRSGRQWWPLHRTPAHPRSAHETHPAVHERVARFTHCTQREGRACAEAHSSQRLHSSRHAHGGDRGAMAKPKPGQARSLRRIFAPLPSDASLRAPSASSRTTRAAWSASAGARAR